MKKFSTLMPAIIYMHGRHILATSMVLLLVLTAWTQAPLVSLQNGQLVYNKYANQRQQNAVNQIPDFSNAGYKGGGVRIPDFPVRETVEPINGDCRALIQAAIDRVSALPLDANGHRGAVLLKAGVYAVDGSLFIKASGVVLRGEGDAVTGTVLIATKKSQHDLIVIQGSGSGYGEISGTRVKIITPYVPTGTKTVEVAANHSFVAGDNIVVQRTPNQAWIDTLNMAQYGWTPSAYRNTFERKVVNVQGNILTLDISIVDPIDQFYGGGDVYKSNITGRISECGIENMRLESYFAGNEDESHGWNAIMVKRAQNSWVRNVIAKYFGYACVNLSAMSRFITVEDCGMIDPKSVTTGGRKYSFNLEGDATSNLFQRCMTWGGRHDYVSGSRVPGPNVFLDCIAENTFADIGPHHRWGTGQLYDNIYGGQIRVQNRGASGSGHGWAGAQILFWNIRSFKSDIEVESPPAARNWGIGCIGVKQTNSGYWESWGTHVSPRSLYLQQLEERLGVQAVQNIVTDDQVQNTLRDKLRTRAGQIAAEPKVPLGGGGGGGSVSFDITDNGGIITAQFPNTTKPSEDYPSLIDNLTNTKYFRSGRRTLWVQYQSSVPAIVVKYTITSANDVPNRDPRDWNLQGSNDGNTWTLLDTRSGQTFASRFLTKTYSFTNTTPYLYYRLNIINNNGETGTQFAEWELYERRIQQISFPEIDDKVYGDEPFELVVSSNSGLPVTLEIVSGPATINDEFLTITGTGTVVVRANQAGDDKYFPAVTEQTFVVDKADQALSFDPISTKTFGDAPFALNASSDAGLPVSFEVIAGPATVADFTLTITGAGEITVRASQAGNQNYNAAAVEQTFTVNKAAQIITFTSITPKNKNETVQLSATASSDLNVQFLVASGPGKINGNTLSFTGEGEVIVRAAQPGSDNYLPAESVNQTVLVFADDEKKDGIKITVYPNPTHGPVKVKLEDKKDDVVYTINIRDAWSQLVASAVVPKGEKKYEIDFVFNESGIYYLYVSDGIQTFVRRILRN